MNASRTRVLVTSLFACLLAALSFSACSLSDDDTSLSFNLPLPTYRTADNQTPVYAVGVTVYDSLSFEKLAVKDFSLTQSSGTYQVQIDNLPMQTKMFVRVVESVTYNNAATGQAVTNAWSAMSNSFKLYPNADTDLSLTLKPCSLVTFLADFEDIEDGSTYIASSSSENVYCFYVTLAVKYSNGFSMNDVCKNLNEMWIVPESNLTSATLGQKYLDSESLFSVSATFYPLTEQQANILWNQNKEYSQSQIEEAKQKVLAKNPVFTATKTFTTSSSSDTVTLSVD